jgi:hypothetical protein
MTEIVDSIVAELIARDNGYVETFERATAAHGRFKASVDKLKVQTFDLGAEGRKYKAGADTIAQSEEQASARMVRAKKATSDASKAAAKVESEAAKAIVKAQAEAEKATLKRQAAEEKAAARSAAASAAEKRRAAERIAALRAEEQAAANQARASAFLSSARPTASNGIGGISNAGSARASAAVFQEQFRVEAAAAKEAAAAEAVLAKERNAAGEAAAKAAKDEAEREAAARARISAVVERSLAEQAASGQKGPGTLFGSSTPRIATHSPTLNLNEDEGAAAAGAQVAAEAEINHLMADQATLQASLTVARGRDRDILRDQITEMRLFNQLVRAGYTEEQATEQVEKRMLAIEAERAKIAARSGARGVGQFAAGAGLGRFGGLNAATGGIAAAIGVAAGVGAIGTSVSYAKELQATSQALGLTTTQLQVYQRAAADVNVSNEQLRSSFGQYAAYLGRAREGDEQAQKAFKALNVDIKGAATAGDLLPTLIQRISGIADPAQRAAVETRIFGEEGRRLDPLLSGGVDKVNDLASAMQRAGSILSAGDIATLQRAGATLAQVKQQLEVDVARVVAGNADAIKRLADSFGDLLRQLGGVSRILKDEGLAQLIFGHNRADVDAAGDPVRYLKEVRVPALVEAQRKFRAVQGGAPSERVAAGRDLANEIRLTQQATRDAVGSQQPIQPGAQPGKAGDLSGLFAPKGKSADQLAREAAAREKRFNDQLARLDEEQLRARADQTSDEQERAAIAVELVNRQRASAIADIKNSLDFTAAQKRRLIAAQNGASDAQIAAINLRQSLSDIEREAATRSLLLDRADDELKVQADIATTAAERRDVEKKLLANSIERQRIANQSVLDRAKAGDSSITQQDIAVAKSNLGNLPTQQKQGESRIDAQNPGPLASYLKTLPTTTDRLNDAFEQAAANGLQNLNDGLSQAVDHFLHLHGLAGTFLSDLIKIGLEREIIAPIANALFPEAGAAAGIGHLFGFAAGGSIIVGGNGGIDNNLLSINGQPVARVNQGEHINIVPSNVAARGASAGPTIVNQSFHLDARYGVMVPELLQYVNQTANSAAARAGAASFKAGQAATPARVQRQQTLGT